MIPNFTIFFTFSIFIFKFFFTKVFPFSYDSCCSFPSNFIFFFLKLIISSACSLKDLQNFLMQSLPLYTSCLFCMFLNDDIVDIEKADRICLPAFVVNDFSVLLLYPLIFSIKHLGFALIINIALSYFRY